MKARRSRERVHGNLQSRNSTMSDRHADPRVVPLFLERWSPRSFDGSGIPAEDLRCHVRGRGLRAFGLQRAALAVPLCASRRRQLGTLPLAAGSVQRQLGKGCRRCCCSLSRQPPAAKARRRGPTIATASMPARPGRLLGVAGNCHGLSHPRHDRTGFRQGARRAWRARRLPAGGRRRDRPPRRGGAPARGPAEREVPSGRRPIGEIAFAGSFPQA